MTRQMIFDLGGTGRLGRADYVVADANRAVFDTLMAWQDWPGARMALAGPPGAGKTHLAHVWAGETGATLVAGPALGDGDVPRLAAGPVAVDEADAVAGDTSPERALFHLLNLSRETGMPLLLTGREAPARWPVALPDLKSRLAALPLTRIAPPDDELLAALFEKLFADRQLAVGEGVIAFLVTRAERSFEAARVLVDRLDAEALERKAELRLPLVRRVLADLAPGDD